MKPACRILDMRDWNEANSVFATSRPSAAKPDDLRRHGEPERYLGAGVSWDLFPMLGTHPIRGRDFTAEDDREGAADVVLLGYDVWMHRYGGSENIIGRPILVNSKPHAVVGVMPQGFAFPNNQKALGPARAARREGSAELPRPLRVWTLKPGVTWRRRAQELDAIAGPAWVTVSGHE